MSRPQYSFSTKAHVVKLYQAETFTAVGTKEGSKRNVIAGRYSLPLLWKRCLCHPTECRACFYFWLQSNVTFFLLSTLWHRWWVGVKTSPLGSRSMIFRSTFQPIIPTQGILDWHGNPSWFSSLLEGADFQTWISQKRLEISISFFQIMKIWYFELHLALVSCHYPNWSQNDSRLKKSVKKFKLCRWTKLLNFQLF